jgi:hypothetical protein
MTREELVGHVDVVRCGDCDGAPPAALVDLALSVSDDAGEVCEFLRMAHYCACQGHCVCGGYVAVTDLEALIAAFEDASALPSRMDWWDAIVAQQAPHAEHRADQHGQVVCAP